MDADLNDNLKDMVEKSRGKVLNDFLEGSFERVFWEEQEKALSQKNAWSMKWHPVFIKWCLYLPHISGWTYEMIRESGCIHLSSQRTLRDYTHYIPAGIRFFSRSLSTVLIGFANLGEINNHLLKFEKELNGESQSMSNIAGTMLVIMVHGLLSKLNFPYAQFACSNPTS